MFIHLYLLLLLICMPLLSLYFNFRCSIIINCMVIDTTVGSIELLIEHSFLFAKVSTTAATCVVINCFCISNWFRINSYEHQIGNRSTFLYEYWLFEWTYIYRFSSHSSYKSTIFIFISISICICVGTLWLFNIGRTGVNERKNMRVEMKRWQNGQQAQIYQ